MNIVFWSMVMALCVAVGVSTPDPRVMWVAIVGFVYTLINLDMLVRDSYWRR